MRVQAAQMKAVARAEFEVWARHYDHSPLHYFLFRPSYRMMLAELLRWERTRRPFDLLDVGCGTGTFAAMVRGCGLPARIVGLDYAATMCAVASHKASEAGASDCVRFCNGDAEQLPFPGGSFDAVTCSNSLHHYPHPELAVRETFRVLRPGGRLIVLDGFRDNVIGWMVFDVIVGRMEKQVRHASWRQMRTFFEQAGLVRIRQRKLNVLFPLLVTVGVAPAGRSAAP